MKTQLFLKILILILIAFSSTYFCQEKFSYGLKGGLSIWRFIYVDHNPNIGGGPDNYYPLGFFAGLFTDTKLSEKVSILNEFSYQNHITKITVYPGDEGFLDQKITTKFVSLSFLLKYQTQWLWDTYFILGPELDYLLKAKYDFYDRVYTQYRGNIEITDRLPKINTFIDFGLGEKFKYSNFNTIAELRTQLSLNRFEYSSQIGKWRNLGFVFLIGFEL